MKDSGVAIMGSAHAEGENRAIKAVQEALTSPLLNDNDISGAKYVLLNITYGSQEVLMDEISDITDYIQDEAGSTADVIWGHGYDETLGDALSVTLIATGFNQSPVTGFEKAPERKVQVLEDDNKKEITEPLSKATSENTYSEAKEEEETEEEPYIKSEVEEEQEDNSNSFNWEVTTASESDTNETEKTAEESESSKEVKRYYLEDDMEEKTEFKSESSKQLTPEEQQRRAQERMDRIQQFASHLKSAEGLNELEKEPAFKRRKINLEDEPHSSEDNISRYEVSDDDDNKTTLRGTNSFLHDNVD